MNSRELYFRLLTYLRPYLGLFMISIAGMVVAALSQPVFPAFLNFMVDGAFAQKQARLFDIFPAKIVPFLIVLLFLLRGTANFISGYAIAWIGSKLVMDLRQAMFAKLLTLPNRYFNEHAAGNLISKLTFDVTQVTAAATSLITTAVKEALTVVALLTYLFFLDWKLTLVTLIVAPLMALIVRKVSKRLRGLSRSTQQAMGGITSVLQEAIEAQRVVKIFGGQAYEQARFGKEIDKARRLAMKQTTANALNSPLIELLAACAVAAIMYMAVISAAENQTTAGGFIAFVSTLMLLFAPLKSLTSVNEPLQRGLAASESVFDLLDETPEIDTGSIDLGHTAGRIEFDRVGFRYQPDTPLALDNVRLVVEPGETIALVGASGSGKTTFASLIPRFFHPVDGRILIDGHPLEDVTLASLRANIALVSQEVLLFNDTVAANIAYGCLAATPEEKIVAAAEAAHATEFIQQMQAGFDTMIGENGVRLSGGQRQRIAIARALLKNAPILILDEATSALDTASERHVQAALETLMQGRTTIVIAHRLSTIEGADRIVVLDKGHIAEIGSHRELITTGGLYARLHQMQYIQEPAAIDA